MASQVTRAALPPRPMSTPKTPSKCATPMEYQIDRYYRDEGYLSKVPFPESIETYSASNSDTDSLDKVQHSMHLCGQFESELTINTGHTDTIQYDLCPDHNYFQSQLSSRRNTAPFCSPVNFDDGLASPVATEQSYDSSTDDDIARRDCKDDNLVRKYPELALTKEEESHQLSLMHSTCEYHRGNSVRLHTMAKPLRGEITSKDKAVIVVRPHGSGEIPEKVNGRRSKSLVKKSSSNADVFSQMEESLYTFGSPIGREAILEERIKAAEPPAKPPRTKRIAPASAPLSRRSTKKSPPTLRFVDRRNNKPVKRLSINTNSSETIIFDKDARIAPSSTSGHSMSSTNTSTRAIPKKSILKRPSTFMKSDRRPSNDPNDALFGPVEHIYEAIDSGTSSDDDRAEALPPPTTSTSETRPTPVLLRRASSRREKPDLRPALPARPFCWPFVLFPPDMTFHPRSFHAYHRKYAIEAGHLPVKEDEHPTDDSIPTERRNSHFSQEFFEEMPTPLFAKKHMPSMFNKTAFR
uniref:UBA domain-containing protein n=1 Tax=Panagrellus redivivus TaxID=6233 RepID=A0A7E4V2J9_PANRE